MKKWLPTIIALATGAAAILAPALQAEIAAHPAFATVVGAAYAILSHLLPSPSQGNPPQA